MGAQVDYSRLFDPRLVAELKRIELRTRRQVSTELLGEYRSAFKGTGLLFSDVREYQPGDDVKHIHWKVTARTGKVYVKSFEEERQLSILLAVDISRSTEFGGAKSKHQKALEFGALVSLLADRTGDAVGLCLFSDAVEEYLPPGRVRSQLHRIVYSLIQARTLRPGTNIGAALQHIKDNQRRPVVLFLVSDFVSPPYEDDLRMLSFRHDIVCVMLHDVLDESLPAAGIVEFYDLESARRVLVDTSSSRTRDAIAKAYQGHVDRVKATAKRLGLDFMMLSDEPLRPLAELMQRRTRRLR